MAAGETCDPALQPASAVDALQGWQRPAYATGLWLAGTPPTRVDAAALWNGSAAPSKDATGMGPEAAVATLRTTYGCYFDSGSAASGGKPRLGQARAGWVFPKAE